MNVALWAEIRRLSEIEKLSHRAIAQRLHCSRRTVKKALAMDQPPATAARLARGQSARSVSAADRRLAGQVSRSCPPSASWRRSAGGRRATGAASRWSGSTCGKSGRRAAAIYQEVLYQPGEAFQVDWGDCGRIQIWATPRGGSPCFVAVLCYSRLVLHRVLAHATQGRLLSGLRPRLGVLRWQSPQDHF